MYSFPMNEDEKIIMKGLASLHLPEHAFHGAVYLTNERIVYVGYVMDIGKKYMEEIPLVRVAEVVGAKTFYVIPNVLAITTLTGETFKFVVDAGERNAWLKAIHAQLEAVNG
jgi:hypothetical protein